MTSPTPPEPGHNGTVPEDENERGQFGQMLRDGRRAKGLERQDIAEHLHGGAEAGDVGDYEDRWRIPKPARAADLIIRAGLDPWAALAAIVTDDIKDRDLAFEWRGYLSAWREPRRVEAPGSVNIGNAGGDIHVEGDVSIDVDVDTSAAAEDPE